MAGINDIPNEILDIVLKFACVLPADKYNMMRVDRRFYAHLSASPIDVANDLFNNSLEANKWLLSVCNKRIARIFTRTLAEKKKEAMLFDDVCINIVRGDITFDFGPRYRCIRSHHLQNCIQISTFPYAQYPTDRMIKYTYLVLPVIRSIIVDFGIGFLKEEYFV